MISLTQTAEHHWVTIHDMLIVWPVLLTFEVKLVRSKIVGRILRLGFQSIFASSFFIIRVFVIFENIIVSDLSDVLLWGGSSAWTSLDLEIVRGLLGFHLIFISFGNINNLKLIFVINSVPTVDKVELWATWEHLGRHVKLGVWIWERCVLGCLNCVRMGRNTAPWHLKFWRTHLLDLLLYFLALGTFTGAPTSRARDNLTTSHVIYRLCICVVDVAL